ncbi:MAG: CDP-alcohol phosphatidyltransferase family protein [Candidatus Micrarchaeota archaeon]|nr:CDP-alcohol phosphatidyltransferase family protein [Candidatus Micrarchaeota archaeon]
MLYGRREKLKGIEKPIGKYFSKLGLTPNQWTVLSILFSIFSAFLLLKSEFLAAGVLILLTGAIDIVDGAVARYTKKSSKRGAYLDTVADRVSEFIVLLGFAAVPYPVFFLKPEIWILLLLFGGMMTTYVKAAAYEKGLGRIKGGILERAERLFALAFAAFLTEFSPLYGICLISLISVFTLISALQRFLIAFRG